MIGLFYQRLIPQHLKDILSLPLPLMAHLHNGGFGVRLSESEWHAVALDECHEMKINRDAKMAVVRPSSEKMEHVSNYLSFRSACLNNLTEQLFPERKHHNKGFSHKSNSNDIAAESNVQAMLEAISEHGMFNHTETKRAYGTSYSPKRLLQNKLHDLMNFREIGQTAMENYINTKIIKQPSSGAPIWKKRLSTFMVTKVAKQRIKRVEKERKLTQQYLKRQLVWIAKHGDESLNSMPNLLGPISPVPRALVMPKVYHINLQSALQLLS